MLTVLSDDPGIDNEENKSHWIKVEPKQNPLNFHGHPEEIQNIVPDFN